MKRLITILLCAAAILCGCEKKEPKEKKPIAYAVDKVVFESVPNTSKWDYWIEFVGDRNNILYTTDARSITDSETPYVVSFGDTRILVFDNAIKAVVYRKVNGVTYKAFEHLLPGISTLEYRGYPEYTTIKDGSIPLLIIKIHNDYPGK